MQWFFFESREAASILELDLTEKNIQEYLDQYPISEQSLGSLLPWQLSQLPVQLVSHPCCFLWLCNHRGLYIGPSHEPATSEGERGRREGGRREGRWKKGGREGEGGREREGGREGGRERERGKFHSNLDFPSSTILVLVTYYSSP